MVNRILVPTINEGCFILYEGLPLPKTSISPKLGGMYGSAILCDLVGGDIALAVMNTLYDETGIPNIVLPACSNNMYAPVGWE